MQKQVLVIKLGSAIITGKDGKINQQLIKKLAEEMANLNQQYHIVLVSSGAVSSGKSYLKDYKGTLSERKAAAAVGNPILIQLYYTYFSQHGLTVGQALCERHHFSNRKQFLQLKDTFIELWEHDIIPIVNENDTVSNTELKFSDNDELATLIAIGFDAASLIICTSAGGFLDKDKKIIPVIDMIDETILSYITKDKSSVGLGGMLSKLTFTRLATSLGIQVIICGLEGETPIKNALEGSNGTTFIPKASNLKARQKWLASGSITLGSIQVDKGAEKALTDRKSLLTVGISGVQGSFSTSEVVQLINEEGEIIGVAKTRLGAHEMISQTKDKNIVAAHADDIVLF